MFNDIIIGTQKLAGQNTQNKTVTRKNINHGGFRILTYYCTIQLVKNFYDNILFFQIEKKW